MLIIDDDPVTRALTARSLLQDGLRAAVASDGHQELQMAHTLLPISALTAYAMSKERAWCFAIGCDNYEPKPIELARLLKKIRALLAATTAS